MWTPRLEASLKVSRASCRTPSRLTSSSSMRWAASPSAPPRAARLCAWATAASGSAVGNWFTTRRAGGIPSSFSRAAQSSSVSCSTRRSGRVTMTTEVASGATMRLTSRSLSSYSPPDPNRSRICNGSRIQASPCPVAGMSTTTRLPRARSAMSPTASSMASSRRAGAARSIRRTAKLAVNRRPSRREPRSRETDASTASAGTTTSWRTLEPRPRARLPASPSPNSTRTARPSRAAAASASPAAKVVLPTPPLPVTRTTGASGG
jgi:hypothetical protein